MITKEDIDYEMEIQENITVHELQKAYMGSIILWLSGSANYNTGKGYFRYVLQYKEQCKSYTKNIENVTANQAYLYGALDAVKRISKPSRICVITAAWLGFESAFRGKGSNNDIIQNIYQEMKDRGCKFTEVRYNGNAIGIKQFIDSVSGKETVDYNGVNNFYAKRNKLDTKRQIYVECIDKVISILQDQVDDEVLEQIKGLVDTLQL